MIKDKPTDPDWLESEEDNCVDAVICMNSLFEIDPESNEPPDPQELSDAKGWFLPLDQDPAQDLHEQVVTAPITVFGITTFSTHSPASPTAGACTSNLGRARVYNINFLTAEARKGPDGQPLPRYQPVSGGGLPPSPVAGKAKRLEFLNDDGTPQLGEDGTPRVSTQDVAFIIGAEGSSPEDAGTPTQDPAKLQPKSLTYWYIEK